MPNPGVLIVSGYGFNCEEETLGAFREAGITLCDVMHVNDLVNNAKIINQYQIMVIPGGFSFGDHMGAGNAMAHVLRSRMQSLLLQFVEQDRLVLGVCNGCQVLVNLGLVGTDNKSCYGICMRDNLNYKGYYCAWVNLLVNSDVKSVWLNNLNRIRLPIAHAEGRFVFNGDFSDYHAMHYADYNPSGSSYNVAALTGYQGRVLAIMPHPERALHVYQRDDYYTAKTKEILPKRADGFYIFANAVKYYQ